MLYPFTCPNCGEFELNLKMSEIPLKECPNCGSEEVERIFVATQSLWKTSGAFSKTFHRNCE